MKKPGIGVIRLAVAAAGVCLCWAQAPKQMTARELFYTAPAKAAAAAKAEAAKPEPAKPAAVKPAPPKAQVAKVAPPKAETPRVEAPKVETAKRESPQTQPDLPGGAKLVTASTTNGAALGVRYSILKYAGDDEPVEVDPDIVFRSGEKIKLRVEVNDPGYLYVVMQGSSGAWRVMFPNQEYDAGSNHVAPGRTYDIPARTRFVFDEQAGIEKLFLVLSRQPVKEMDSLIYELEGGAKPKAAQDAKTMLASASIGDSLVGKLRDAAYARDLVFEKVDDKAPAPAAGGKKETAVYVVNTSHAADSRLVADVVLRHR